MSCGTGTAYDALGAGPVGNSDTLSEIRSVRSV